MLKFFSDRVLLGDANNAIALFLLSHYTIQSIMKLFQQQLNMRSNRRAIVAFTSFGLISALLNCQPAQAQDRHRNAYGLGLDLHWYCAYQYGPSASVYMVEQSAYGFRCASGNRVMNIDMNHICQLMYGPSHQAIMANAREKGSWYCSDQGSRSRSQHPRSRSRINRVPASQPPHSQDSWTPEPTVPSERTVNLNSTDSKLLDLTNAQRQQAGQPPLRFSSQLDQAAQAYAEDFSRNPNLPPHTGSDGSSVGDRVTQTGYTFSWVGENVYTEAPNSSPTSAIRGWMNSPGHRANILNSNFTEIGFGYAYNPSTQIHTYVQVFGTPRDR